jgi:cytochrome c oxidase subunit III
MDFDMATAASTPIVTVPPRAEPPGFTKAKLGKLEVESVESVRRLEPAKLGLLLFITMEIMLFAGIISAFLMFHAGPIQWPPPDQPRLPVGVTAVNTLILLVSGFSFYRASQALKSGRYIAFLEGLEVTTWLGFLFLAIQGTEWIRLVHFGLTLYSGVFGGFFYLLVGLHGLHVAGGLLALFWMKDRASRGYYAGGDTLAVELCRMYWYFVVGLWPLLFALVYL